jgi:hypothetical protein
MPAVFLILTIVIVKTWQAIPDLPPLKIDMKVRYKIIYPIPVRSKHVAN